MNSVVLDFDFTMLVVSKQTWNSEYLILLHATWTVVVINLIKFFI